jgi:hypothetical protein
MSHAILHNRASTSRSLTSHSHAHWQENLPPCDARRHAAPITQHFGNFGTMTITRDPNNLRPITGLSSMDLQIMGPSRSCWSQNSSRSARDVSDCPRAHCHDAGRPNSKKKRILGSQPPNISRPTEPNNPKIHRPLAADQRPAEYHGRSSTDSPRDTIKDSK